MLLGALTLIELHSGAGSKTIKPDTTMQKRKAVKMESFARRPWLPMLLANESRHVDDPIGPRLAGQPPTLRPFADEPWGLCGLRRAYISNRHRLERIPLTDDAPHSQAEKATT